MRKNHTFIFDLTAIDVVVLSHAHVDHSGNLPNLVPFVEYATKKTLTRKIMDNQYVVKVFWTEHNVTCKIQIIDVFSAHANRRNLLNYVNVSPPSRLKHIFLFHGEPEQALSLKDTLQSKKYENIHFPIPDEKFTYNTRDTHWHLQHNRFL